MKIALTRENCQSCHARFTMPVLRFEGVTVAMMICRRCPRKKASLLNDTTRLGRRTSKRTAMIRSLVLALFVRG